ncbi:MULTISPECIES: pyroglutamyl-peptidase I [Brevibacillus]|uniref:pyroglutamyl-peptidase I n=1 Tax=Brevibacillus TaxID=55080 RepID=UPI00156B3DD2|nr:MULTISPECIES: pyroglutamyl-peptidase I [Brevibacillus]MBU8712349.1 pyroglutamyl-peptidase I [Brevibacillus parabrevis]MDH6349420.1 pyroglutamyl-peptidase [Brevibacillus sp. 1238]MED2257310.1 pyroglutamyl-peptidase I [Brevibacillus parabrevis]NRQ52446.1 pyroglutamyl-peptidase I [Brevibacillus sp. HD1.4A]UED71642.1 pyroglutamyl-peptidase I [Brevibacillus sp. HD3.3A]
MKTILVTGFDPFGGEAINPAWESVKRLAEVEAGEYRIVARQLPTVFGKSVELLLQAIREISPDLVFCIGQAGGRADISIERVAINVDDARIPDNAGKQPIDTPIVEDGPVAYWSSLPIKAIVKEMRAKGIPASVSQTAGTFVCNHLFYGLMHALDKEYPAVRGGFVHIPYLPEQAAKHPGQPSMSVETIVNGLQIAIETAVNHERDIVEGGGQIS